MQTAWLNWTFNLGRYGDRPPQSWGNYPGSGAGAGGLYDLKVPSELLCRPTARNVGSIW